MDWTALQEHYITKLALSVCLGALIGLEREVAHKPAGIRTHVLVCLGSTLFMILSLLQVDRHPGGAALPDPNRVLAQIVTGVGFLGAGTILQARGGVRGLTTAASIWVVAAIGAAVGAGFYRQAAATTATAVFLLSVVGRLPGRGDQTLHMLEIVCGLGADTAEVARRVEAKVRNPRLASSRSNGERTVLDYEVDCDSPTLIALVTSLGQMSGVQETRTR